MFKKETLGNYVLMGRKTFESCGELKLRTNVIVTTNTKGIEISKNSSTTSYLKSSIAFLKSLKNKKNKDKIIFVVGGQSIYEQTINESDEVWVTEVKSKFPKADKFYNIDLSCFVEYSRIKNYKDNCHKYDYDFVKYKRKQ